MKKELFEKRNKLLADYQSLQNEAKSRQWTNEDETRSAAMLNELEAIDKAVEREERFEKIAARTNEAANKPVTEDRQASSPETEQRKSFRNFLRTGETRTALGLNKATDSAGGYLAPPDLAKDLLSIVVEQSFIRDDARVVETSLGSVPFPRMSVAMTGAWVAENGTVAATQPTYATVSVPINKFAFQVPVSVELLQDGLFNVEGHITQEIAIECARGENAGFVAGTGVTGGCPMGLIDVTHNGVTAKKSGSDGSFDADDLVDLMYSLKAPYIDKGEWIMNRATFAAVAKMKVGTTGQYVFSPTGFGVLAGTGFAPTILGRPFELSPDMPISVLGGGTGTPISLCYCDPATSYVIVQKPSSQLLSIVRDPYTAANSGNVVFWVTYRVGGAVVMPEAVALLQEKA